MTDVMTPWWRNIFTDVFGSLQNFQEHETCATYELRVVDCLEAYGTHHGKTKCRDLIQDLRECALKCKQMERIIIMDRERHRQVKDGERNPEDLYAPPPTHID